MIKININNAFDGFLYAPLFLADKLGYFPACSELKFRNGDSECLDALCEHPDEDIPLNWFAICDPFSIDISKKVPQDGDDLCVIGCLVDKLPVWVYNINPSITRVKSEKDIANYKKDVRKLRCYKEGTTGYLVGRRLKNILELRDDELEQKEFGEEFSGGIPENTLVATSDILRVV
ncbi:MAG: hypothetical protein HGA87_06975, partial [Desulfobulbaceae bacterium]|nr:hypothetical protein [Desulfobulbaceae bacterium]